MTKPRFFLLLLLAACHSLHAQQSLCAIVKIEIQQELSLERQAFEARMTITNSATAPLNNFTVTLVYQDKNQLVFDNSGGTTQRFFQRTLTSGGVPTTIAPSETKKIEWQLIPTNNAGGIDPQGELYFIGALVQYNASGKDEKVNVTPDSIYVKPLPQLQLDYFLPYDVFGNDPFTTEIEAPVPFTLGVRVKNQGKGSAQAVKIESGQPKIIDNKAGLLIAFAIIGSEVNGLPAQPNFTVDFGTILSNRAAVGRWFMTTTLSGYFSEFEAVYSHSDELGGKLTSLIQDPIGKHTLIHEVNVDLPGRDGFLDFLAIETPTSTVYRVYESDSADTIVSNLSSSATISQNTLTINTSTTGFAYIQVPDPQSGQKGLFSVKRADGKLLKKENFWIAPKLDRNTHLRSYTLNIFDFNPTSTYQITYESSNNRPPILDPVSDQSVNPGAVININFSATDPDGTIPSVTLGNAAPSGSVFTSTAGKGNFTWTPTVNQLGQFPLRVMASDGLLSDSKTMTVTVTTDTFYDSWRKKYFGDSTDPNVIGQTADPDGDGFNNLLEYALDLDPTVGDAELGTQTTLETILGKRYLQMTYIKRTNDPLLTYQVIAAPKSNSPANEWIPVTQAISIGQEGVPSLKERVKIRDTAAIEDGIPARFLKLKVTYGG